MVEQWMPPPFFWTSSYGMATTSMPRSSRRSRV
jgi:hypothetical protein